ncbi:MAG TPA: hypothetical protein VK517_00985 [Cyclobacteriaceae bacterium]|nr:hypothetical protein [Cyclobacteriaceae bacterium]
MVLAERIKAFGRLGDMIAGLPQDELEVIQQKATGKNPWFTADSVAMALNGITRFLGEPVLHGWTSSYTLERQQPKTIGVVMAGNIPLVGFHDFLCVLISGNRLKAKLSSQDSFLIPYLFQLLIRIEPGFHDLAQFAERLDNIDAVIATGSDNTARYFEYYFRTIPRIIRRNRSSCAIVSGEESTGDLTALGTDVFSYFGLGCRNVSKVYVPEGYDFTRLFQAWEKFSTVLHHHKYTNNYDYQKSILLVNRSPFFDNGFILLKNESTFVSPVSVLYFEYYSNVADLQKKIESHQDKIQCIVSAQRWFTGSEALGQAQFPDVTDYADKADTLKFLTEIAKNA